MDSYAFVVGLETSGSFSGGPVPRLAEGLHREMAFEQAGPAGHWLVVYQEGPAAGQVTALPGVEIPKVELALSAKPAASTASDTYAFAIPLLPGVTEEWLDF